MEETELIDLLRSHDPKGAEALLARYTPLMKYVIAPILPDERDREDCLSELAMLVWEKIDRFDPDRGSWTGWLTALARNTALNRLRQTSRHAGQQPPDEELPAPGDSPEEALLRQERQDTLMTALYTLSDHDRRLFYRKYYYLQPTAQIAAELGLSTRAVEGRLYRIKQRLRQLLGGERHD